MTGDAEYLLVRAGARLVGLPLAQVAEVVAPGEAYPVPSAEPAMRGVVTIRGRILPLVHLGVLLDGGACPPAPGDTGIIVTLEGRQLCLEVEAAESVLHDAGLPLPPGTSLPGAVAVGRYAQDVVPLLDLRLVAGALGAGAAPSMEAKAV